MTTVSTFTNPELANDLLSKATSQQAKEVKRVDIIAPWNNSVTLPGGYITPAGDVFAVAEVRELTGKDEEAIGKATDGGRQFLTILSRGVVAVGGEPATEAILDGMLVGDRDMVMLGIYKATFGPDVVLDVYCSECQKVTDFTVNVDDDIPVKRLDNPQDRDFLVKGRKEIRCYLPTGATQKAILLNPDRPVAEMTTDVLQNSIVEIDGDPVFSKDQVLELGVADRRLVSEQLLSKSPGPQLSEATGHCNACDTSTTVGVNLGAIFRF